jgi:Rieske Fe-S protein
MSCEDCLSRRAFLAKSALAAVAIAAVGCGDGQIGPTAVTASQLAANGGLKIDLADYPGLANVGTLVRIKDATVGVVRTSQTTFVASSTICTHEGCDTNVDNNQYFCPCHDSLFSATGALLRGPADRPLDSFPTSFDPTTNILTIT